MLRKYREAQNEEGFTLIELLVVVLIIGILAAIAIPVFLDQRQKAYANAAESDARNLALAVEDFASDNNGSYNVSTMVFTPSDGVTLNVNIDQAATPSVAGYCIEATHEALSGTVWTYDASGSTTNAKVEEGTSGACAAGLTPVGDGVENLAGGTLDETF